MKKIILIALALITLTMHAQNIEGGKIVIKPYLESSENALINRASKVLLHKLNAVINRSGMVGTGFDDRFIITAHAVELESTITETVPAKYSTTLMLTIYVGDGVDGTLFSQWSTELKAVGDNKDELYVHAFRKLSPNDPGLIEMLDEGKRRIIQYYNNFGPKIIAKAKAKANAGRYDEAVSDLMAIPSVCSSYSQAMNLAGQIGAQGAEKNNLKIVADARAQWSADPTEKGAEQAQATLSQLEMPSASVLAQAKQLTKEIVQRLELVDDRAAAFERKMAAYEHKETMARIDSKTQIAKANANARRASYNAAAAYYNSRPRVTYHFHWW